MRLNFNGIVGEISSCPGNSQIAVSHGVFNTNKGNGAATQANAERLAHLKEVLGYDYALCTVCEDNDAQLHILYQNQWEYLDSFKSSKTGNTVLIYGKHL